MMSRVVSSAPQAGQASGGATHSVPASSMSRARRNQKGNMTEDTSTPDNMRSTTVTIKQNSRGCDRSMTANEHSEPSSQHSVTSEVKEGVGREMGEIGWEAHQEHTRSESSSTAATSDTLASSSPTLTTSPGLGEQQRLSSIGVVVRVRPLSTFEHSNPAIKTVVRCLPFSIVVDPVHLQSAADRYYGTTKAAQRARQFDLDDVFHPRSTQIEVYERACRHVVEGAFRGVNGAILAYGATGAGKTHTMFGDEISAAGVVFQAMQDIFDEKKRLEEEEGKVVTIRITFLEVYNEDVFDLLTPRSSSSTGNTAASPTMSPGSGTTGGNMQQGGYGFYGSSGSGSSPASSSPANRPTRFSSTGSSFGVGFGQTKRQPLQVRDVGPEETGSTARGGVPIRAAWPQGSPSYSSPCGTCDFAEATARRTANPESLVVAGLSVATPTTLDDFARLIEKGHMSRFVAVTSVNAHSSRSHAIITVEIEVQDEADLSRGTIGRIRFCDLAGSERAASTSNMGIRLREGGNINKSLLALGTVVQALVQRRSKPDYFIPYRGSKLTRLLRDCLGGNCRTQMLFCLNPASNNYEETINTMLFAMQAKKVRATAKRNEFIVNTKSVTKDQEALIEQLRAEVVGLRDALARANHGNSHTHSGSAHATSPSPSPVPRHFPQADRKGSTSVGIVMRDRTQPPSPSPAAANAVSLSVQEKSALGPSPDRDGNTKVEGGNAIEGRPRNSENAASKAPTSTTTPNPLTVRSLNDKLAALVESSNTVLPNSGAGGGGGKRAVSAIVEGSGIGHAREELTLEGPQVQTNVSEALPMDDPITPGESRSLLASTNSSCSSSMGGVLDSIEPHSALTRTSSVHRHAELPPSPPDIGKNDAGENSPLPLPLQQQPQRIPAVSASQGPRAYGVRQGKNTPQQKPQPRMGSGPGGSVGRKVASSYTSTVPSTYSEGSKPFVSLQLRLASICEEKETLYRRDHDARERKSEMDMQLRQLQWKLAEFLCKANQPTSIDGDKGGYGAAPQPSGKDDSVGVTGLRAAVARAQAECQQCEDSVGKLQEQLNTVDKAFAAIREELLRERHHPSLDLLLSNAQLRQSCTEAECLASYYHQECHKLLIREEEYSSTLEQCVSAMKVAMASIPENTLASSRIKNALLFATLPAAPTTDMLTFFEKALNDGMLKVAVAIPTKRKAEELRKVNPLRNARAKEPNTTAITNGGTSTSLPRNQPRQIHVDPSTRSCDEPLAQATIPLPSSNSTPPQRKNRHQQQQMERHTPASSPSTNSSFAFCPVQRCDTLEKGHPPGFETAGASAPKVTESLGTAASTSFRPSEERSKKASAERQRSEPTATDSLNKKAATLPQSQTPMSSYSSSPPGKVYVARSSVDLFNRQISVPPSPVPPLAESLTTANISCVAGTLAEKKQSYKYRRSASMGAAIAGGGGHPLFSTSAILSDEKVGKSAEKRAYNSQGGGKAHRSSVSCTPAFEQSAVMRKENLSEGRGVHQGPTAVLSSVPRAGKVTGSSRTSLSKSVDWSRSQGAAAPPAVGGGGVGQTVVAGGIAARRKRSPSSQPTTLNPSNLHALSVPRAQDGSTALRRTSHETRLQEMEGVVPKIDGGNNEGRAKRSKTAKKPTASRRLRALGEVAQPGETEDLHGKGESSDSAPESAAASMSMLSISDGTGNSRGPVDRPVLLQNPTKGGAKGSKKTLIVDSIKKGASFGCNSPITSQISISRQSMGRGSMLPLPRKGEAPCIRSVVDAPENPSGEKASLSSDCDRQLSMTEDSYHSLRQKPAVSMTAKPRSPAKRAGSNARPINSGATSVLTSVAPKPAKTGISSAAGASPARVSRSQPSRPVPEGDTSQKEVKSQPSKTADPSIMTTQSAEGCGVLSSQEEKPKNTTYVVTTATVDVLAVERAKGQKGGNRRLDVESTKSTTPNGAQCTKGSAKANRGRAISKRQS